MCFRTTAKIMLIAAAGLFVSIAGILPASAVDFSGKKITIIVPFKEGGGTDGLARLFAPYLQKELPGNPDVIVLNQPGGGGVTGSNKFQRTDVKDGTVLGMGSTSTFVAYAIGGEKVKYDPMSWEPIILMLRGAIVYANGDKMGLKGGLNDPKGDVAIAQSKPVIIGMKTPTSAELSDYISWRILGANVKPVFGLSTSKQRKAFFREEIMANVDGTGPYLKKLLANLNLTQYQCSLLGTTDLMVIDFEILMRLICQRWKSFTKQLLEKRQKARLMTLTGILLVCA